MAGRAVKGEATTRIWTCWSVAFGCARFAAARLFDVSNGPHSSSQPSPNESRIESFAGTHERQSIALFWIHCSVPYDRFHLIVTPRENGGVRLARYCHSSQQKAQGS